jgi:hypothetical protein
MNRFDFDDEEIEKLFSLTGIFLKPSPLGEDFSTFIDLSCICVKLYIV